jgi:hypothetical protein
MSEKPTLTIVQDDQARDVPTAADDRRRLDRIAVLTFEAFHGDDLNTPWEELAEDIREKWVKAARAVDALYRKGNSMEVMCACCLKRAVSEESNGENWQLCDRCLDAASAAGAFKGGPKIMMRFVCDRARRLWYLEHRAKKKAKRNG